MRIEGQVGPQVVSDGSFSEIRQGKAGDLIISQLHGRYYEAAFRKSLFTAYAVAVATSVVGTGMIGLQVWNGSPIAGGINLVLMKVGGMNVVTSASMTSVVLATGTGQVSAPT